MTFFRVGQMVRVCEPMLACTAHLVRGGKKLLHTLTPDDRLRVVSDPAGVSATDVMTEVTTASGMRFRVARPLLESAFDNTRGK